MYKFVVVFFFFYLYVIYIVVIVYVGFVLKLNMLFLVEKYFLGVFLIFYYVRECFINIVFNLEIVLCLKYFMYVFDGRGKLVWSLKIYLICNKFKMY